VREKYGWCLVERCDLLSFCIAKEEREKARGGARKPRCARERVRSTRGPGASALRGADGGGVGARAVAAYRQSERARGISSGHMMLMPCGAGYIKDGYLGWIRWRYYIAQIIL